ncbi:unnamed protein product [Ophioblennius macclurei]
MDSAHSGRDMSPLYVRRKRKRGAPCPVVQRNPERVGDVTLRHYLEKDEAAMTKRTSARKRYEDLQSVSMATMDDPVPSCSVMSLGGSTNGSALGSVASPTSRKDTWTRRPNGGPDSELRRWVLGPDPSQDQVWDADRDRAWGAGRWAYQNLMERREEEGPEQNWRASRDQNQNQDQDQAWNGGQGPARDQQEGTQRVQDQNWSQTSRERGDVWRPGSDQAAQASRSSVGLDQKPAIVPNRKEPPSYPPGSPEERWQVQITAKGRVTCPRCRSVSRKTVEGLKKHMKNCRLQLFTCQFCGKQLKSSTGMKYHVMADHSHLPSVDDASQLDDRSVKDKLRKVLKRLGKLRCSKEGCGAAFSSIMGYVYHMKKCGKEEAELEKMLLRCSHCGKTYRSKAGLEYHLKSEHTPTPQKTKEDEETRGDAHLERTASGRVQRASAQVANFHLAEIASNDLPKDWPKRKFQSDLVPDDKKLKYARPGLPAFSQEVLRKWKNEVKLQRKVQCPNQGCSCTYTSVSGLKAHLGLCTRGDFEAGKYRCLICNKEFNSESGVKYHISSVHAQEWFVTNKKASKKFEKFLKNQPKQFVDHQSASHLHHHHHLQHLHRHHHHHHHHHQYQHHQPQVLHPDRPCFPHKGEPPLLYTPLEPPVAAMWMEMEQREDVPGPEQAPIEMELAVIDKEEVQEMEEEVQEEERSRRAATAGPEGAV